MKLFGFRLLVSDFSTSLAFWRDIMALPVVFSDEAIGYAYFTLDTTALELFSREAFAAAVGLPADVPSGSLAVINIKVEDVEATFADLVARGATVVANPQDRPMWQARTAHISDPNGYLVELYSSLDPGQVPTA